MGKTMGGAENNESTFKEKVIMNDLDITRDQTK